ncbi:MAG TPA: YebC/PmpR family DNA-binding transcriptional regulator [Alphaproteobacteria bacterium]|nr:YebC/PmpR family DNA-binding transcriptional regulator [Alphaproteobacteria bacterium]
MAGHSKFKNIQFRKGAQDAKRAKLFSKMAREITVAAKTGLPEAEKNPRLRNAIINARAENMPKDRIEKAIQKAIGGNDDAVYEEIRYEGYGPGSIAIIIDVLTDNRNRTASEIRSAFSKNGGALGETGSLSFVFTRKGVIKFNTEKCDENTFFELAAESGAEDINSDITEHTAICMSEDFGNVRDSLTKNISDPISAKLEWVPQTLQSINEEQAEKILKFIDILEDNDDVQTVYTNLDITEEVMEKINNN